MHQNILDDDNKEKIIINSKSLARIGAIQALYMHNTMEDSEPDDLIDQIKRYYRSSRKLKEDFEIDDAYYLKANIDEDLLSLLVTNSIVNLELIDGLISQHLVDPWNISKLHPLLKAIVRAAVCELKFFPATSYKIVINDFVNIATEMLSSSGEINFANAILDKVYRQLSTQKDLSPDAQ